MGKPRLIILIRHAQSEGNKNREVHQFIPDHRVKLTDEGHRQAEEAGRRLRALLKPDDTLQIFTSPYRRTRETTEGLLKTLTASPDPDDPRATPSPISRSKIKVYEEPRIREQDFGNFQPCSAEMERMWQERADYGHFFYRIPNGESAADAYDRVCGFGESLWRQFGDRDFPSVCVLVTHGLMTRVFLMKWYHWSVEYFEDLRNINHCEFITMRQTPETGKYVLETELRTWSEWKRQKAQEERDDPQRRNTLSHFLTEQESPRIPPRKWGGCVGGCNHDHGAYPRRRGLEKAAAPATDVSLGPSATAPASMQKASAAGLTESPTTDAFTQTGPTTHSAPTDDTEDQHPPIRATPSYLQRGRDGGGGSGANTPHEMNDEDGYFNIQTPAQPAAVHERPARKPTEEDMQRWMCESGMGRGTQADGLGDEPDGRRLEVTEEEREEEQVRGKGKGRVEDEEGAHVVHGDVEGVAEGGLDELERQRKEDQSVEASVY
ncbi:phosphoglycerate mutase-like protein [Teratosphaeria nubilosa]|uniref:Phosphoglycerate mutase-like protein n=1 Tax=Teratosphaeria nubilosa TaxID=161662 RepID=A0A6G1L5X9_9PEZI|nr:phosphoglycerate mutase-like protein [Teratosphaeria nubilosa]